MIANLATVALKLLSENGNKRILSRDRVRSLACQALQLMTQGALTIESVNIKTVTVKYYMIDAEILFSRAPFLKNNAEEFSYVKPCV